MNRKWGVKLAIVLSVIIGSGCAINTGYQLGLKALQEKDFDTALVELEKADAEYPDDIRIDLALQQARRLKAEQYFQQVRTLLLSGDFSQAEMLLEKALILDPALPFANQYILDLQRFRQAESYYQEGMKCTNTGELDLAVKYLKEVLSLNPDRQDAIRLLEEIQRKITSENQRKSKIDLVSFDFQDMALGDAFRALAEVTDFNLLIDESVDESRLVNVTIREVSAEEIIDTLASANGLLIVTINERTKILCKDSQECRQRYARDDVKLFVLRYADAERLRQILEPVTGDAVVLADKRTNSVVVRARPDRMPLVAELINAMDIRESEVLVDVEILEVTRTKMEDIGIDLGDNPVIKADIGGPLHSNKLGGRLSWAHLNDLSSGSLFLTMPSVYMNLLKKDGHTKILAEPRLRIVNRTAARLHIGEQIPIKTTSSVFRDTSEEMSSFAYRDVGIVMNLTPRILSETELALDLKLEVSSIIDATDQSHPTIGTREVETTLRLQDGQVEVIAGLLKDEERQGRTKIPLLGEMPILGHLFSSKTGESVQTDIIISLTPHIVDRRVMKAPENSLWTGEMLSKSGRDNYSGSSSTGNSRHTGTALPMELDARLAQDSALESSNADAQSELDNELPTDQNIVSIEPVDSRCLIGESQQCRVTITGAKDVGSVPFYIDYNPNIIEIVGVNEGEFLGSDGAPTVFMSSINAQRGRLVIGLSRVGSVGGISGDGNLIFIEYKGTKAGLSPLAFSRESVMGPAANLLPSRFIDGQVSVQSK